MLLVICKNYRCWSHIKERKRRKEEEYDDILGITPRVRKFPYATDLVFLLYSKGYLGINRLPVLLFLIGLHFIIRKIYVILLVLNNFYLQMWINKEYIFL